MKYTPFPMLPDLQFRTVTMTNGMVNWSCAIQKQPWPRQGYLLVEASYVNIEDVVNGNIPMIEDGECIRYWVEFYDELSTTARYLMQSRLLPSGTIVDSGFAEFRTVLMHIAPHLRPFTDYVPQNEKIGLARRSHAYRMCKIYGGFSKPRLAPPNPNNGPFIYRKTNQYIVARAVILATEEQFMQVSEFEQMLNMMELRT